MFVVNKKLCSYVRYTPFAALPWILSLVRKTCLYWNVQCLISMMLIDKLLMQRRCVMNCVSHFCGYVRKWQKVRADLLLEVNRRLWQAFERLFLLRNSSKIQYIIYWWFFSYTYLYLLAQFSLFFAKCTSDINEILPTVLYFCYTYMPL